MGQYGKRSETKTTFTNQNINITLFMVAANADDASQRHSSRTCIFVSREIHFFSLSLLSSPFRLLLFVAPTSSEMCSHIKRHLVWYAATCEHRKDDAFAYKMNVHNEANRGVFTGNNNKTNKKKKTELCLWRMSDGDTNNLLNFKC